jgi:hypothetical protein
VEKISVVGMMSHSFKEYRHLSQQKKYDEELETVKEKMKAISSHTQQQGLHWKPLSDFYDMAAEYLQLWSDVRVGIFFSYFTRTEQQFSLVCSFLKILEELLTNLASLLSISEKILNCSDTRTATKYNGLSHHLGQ